MKRTSLTILIFVLIALPGLAGAQNYLDRPESIAFDTLGNRYLVTNIGGSIVAIDTFGVQSVVRDGMSLCLSNHLDGNVLYVSLQTGIGGFDLTDTTLSWFWPYPSSQGTDGLAADTSGYLYGVAPGTRIIYKINIADLTHTELVTTGLPGGPQDIEFDARHNRLLVCAYVANVPLVAVDVVTGALDTLVVSETSFQDGITMDDEGNVYLGCGSTGRVYMYDSLFTNPPTLIASGYVHVAGLHFNKRDGILAVPDFEADSVNFINLGLPSISFVGQTLDDSAGDNDGHADVGETVQISTTVHNSGGEGSGINGTLSTTDPYITVTQPTSSFGATLARGDDGSSQTPFEFTVDPSCPDPHIVSFTLDIADDDTYTTSHSFYLYVGETAGLDDDMESGEGFWDHLAASDGFYDGWQLSTTRANSGSTSWWAGGPSGTTYADRSDGGLVTPPFLLPHAAALTFSHWLDVEVDASPGLAWDGAIVMIGTGDGNWEQIFPIEDYPYTIIDNPASPFAPGTPCYSGTSDWSEVEFDLSAYSGVVQIMFRFGSDAAANQEGWYVDDVAIVSRGCCGQYNEGYTGNSNCSEDGKVTLSDITQLIDRVYISKAELCCEANGNVNGSLDGMITLSDITAVIDHVYISKDPTSPCP